jgi:lysyl-tRNA synthetase class 2
VIREYFASQGFLEIDPPQRVRAPGVDRHVDALRAQDGYLVTSPELGLKRLLVGGIPRLYSLSHAFRRNEQGNLHEPEFLLLEWYRAFAGQPEVERDTEEVVVAVARALRGKSDLVTPTGRRLDLRTPFPRLSVSEAFARHAGIRDVASLAAEDEDRYFELFVARVEPALAKLDRPLFLFDYPLSQAALARPSREDPRFAERFELYAGGIELCNGYGELTDPREQRRRFHAERLARRKARRPVYPTDRRFLRALAEGMPPSGGNALGVDRLILLATGANSVQEVVPLPWERT